MKFLKSLLMGTGGVVLAGLVLALLAPKAVHAIVATAAQVVNTSANPAITEDASRQASQIVTIQCGYTLSIPKYICRQVLPTGFYNIAPGTGPDGGYLVPEGQYLVIKSMDAFYQGATTEIRVNLGIGTVESVFLPSSSQASFSSGIVAGPGVEVWAFPVDSIVDGVVTFHGYLTSN